MRRNQTLKPSPVMLFPANSQAMQTVKFLPCTPYVSVLALPCRVCMACLSIVWPTYVRASSWLAEAEPPNKSGRVATMGEPVPAVAIVHRSASLFPRPLHAPIVQTLATASSARGVSERDRQFSRARWSLDATESRHGRPTTERALGAHAPNAAPAASSWLIT